MKNQELIVEVLKKERDVIKVTIECSKIDENVDNLKSYIEMYDTRIRIKDKGIYTYMEMSDIFFFESVDNRTFLYTKDEVKEITYRLYELEDLLPQKYFIRISKSQIVNISKIIGLYPQINRTILATLENNESLYISRSYVKELKKLLNI